MTAWQDQPPVSRRQVRQTERDENVAPQATPEQDAPDDTSFAGIARQGWEAEARRATAPQGPPESAVEPPASRGRRVQQPATNELGPDSTPEPLLYITQARPQVPSYDGASFRGRAISAVPHDSDAVTPVDPAPGAEQPEYRNRDFSPSDSRRSAFRPVGPPLNWAPPVVVPLPEPIAAPAIEAAAPAPSAPTSSAPVSSAPVSSAPVSSAPVSSAPVSSAPVASESSSQPAPVLTRRQMRELGIGGFVTSPSENDEAERAAAAAASLPATPVDAAPVEEAPTEAAPIDAVPVDAEPVFAEPVFAEPVFAEPVFAEPVSALPVEDAPIVAAPTAAAPIADAPVETAPVEPLPVESGPVEEVVVAEVATERPRFRDRASRGTVDPELEREEARRAAQVSEAAAAPHAGAEAPVFAEAHVIVEPPAFVEPPALIEPPLRQLFTGAIPTDVTVAELVEPPVAPPASREPVNSPVFNVAPASDHLVAEPEIVVAELEPNPESTSTFEDLLFPGGQPVETTVEPAPADAAATSFGAFLAGHDAPAPTVSSPERAVAEPEDSYVPPVGHWSTQALIDDDVQVQENTFARDVGATSGAITTSALVLPSMPTGEDIMGPLSGTGEILITGSINLPSSMGSTGVHPARYDHSDVDALLEADDREDSSDPESAPVRAIRAISTNTASGDVINSMKPQKASRLPLILIVSAAVMAVGVVVLLVAGLIFKIF